jgi:uncharacterized protein YgbK (DUF1537 family)
LFIKIAIIADDLTGAAELASASADLGFATEVHTQFDPASDAEVIAIDSNTRALPSAEAAKKVIAIAAAVKSARPEWIYKKTDSVLRGNVRVEIEAILAALGSSAASLISANPGKGRRIQHGQYTIDGVSLRKTAFAYDPDHPRRSSDVLTLLGESHLPLVSVSIGEPLLQFGISVPDAYHPDHLIDRAHETPPESLAAGGVEFFQALLQARTSRSEFLRHTFPTGKSLHLCGSAHAWQQGRSTQGQTFILPESLYSSEPADPARAIADWANEISAYLKTNNHALMSIGRDPKTTPTQVPPTILETYLAQAAAIVLASQPLARVYIEGGATAAALLRALNWTRLSAQPTSQYPGVATLAHAQSATTLFLKPGSYPWPVGLLP